METAEERRIAVEVPVSTRSPRRKSTISSLLDALTSPSRDALLSVSTEAKGGTGADDEEGIPLEQFPVGTRQSLSLLVDSDRRSITPGQLQVAASLYKSHRKEQKKMKLYTLFAVMALVFLAVCNLASTIIAIEVSKETTVASGTGILEIAGTQDAVQVAQSLVPHSLNSRLPEAFFAELRYFTATSSTGASVRLQVQSYMILPARECLPPIVKLVTPVGSVYIEGTVLDFDAQNVNPFFLEAGFLTGNSAPTRRRLADATLVGFFNTLYKLVDETDANSTCLPTLPTMPWRLVGMSKDVELCGIECKDVHGFVIPDLTGVEMINGLPFIAYTTSTSISSMPSATNGGNLTQVKTVKAFPRYPELYAHSLNNGTHTMKWVEFEGHAYRCNSLQPINAATTQSNEEEIANGLIPEIRYEGFTYFSSEHYTNVPSLMYTMAWPALKIKQEYFSVAHNPDVVIGLSMYSWNSHVDDYEVIQRSDFWGVKVNNDVELEDLEADFRFPDACVSNEGIIALPPDPRREKVGKGYVMSSGGHTTWGETLPTLDVSGAPSPLPANESICCEDNAAACAYLNDSVCDDGGPGALYADCPLGTDCTDCGSRCTSRRTLSQSCPPGSPPPQSYGPFEMMLDTCNQELELTASAGEIQGIIPIDISGSISFAWEQLNPLVPRSIAGSVTAEVNIATLFRLIPGPGWVISRLLSYLGVDDLMALQASMGMSAHSEIFSTCSNDNNQAAASNSWHLRGNGVGLDGSFTFPIDAGVASWEGSLRAEALLSPFPAGSASGDCSNTCYYPSDGWCDDGGPGVRAVLILSATQFPSYHMPR
jgi:hypothetical protein